MQLYTYYLRPMNENPKIKPVVPVHVETRKLKIFRNWGRYDMEENFSNVVDLGSEPFAPSEENLRRWHASKKTPEDWAVFERDYRAGLDASGIDAIHSALMGAVAGADMAILVCHEGSRNKTYKHGKAPGKTYYCHRRILAEWIEGYTGEKIPEL